MLNLIRKLPAEAIDMLVGAATATVFLPLLIAAMAIVEAATH